MSYIALLTFLFFSYEVQSSDYLKSSPLVEAKSLYENGEHEKSKEIIESIDIKDGDLLLAIELSLELDLNNKSEQLIDRYILINSNINLKKEDILQAFKIGRESLDNVDRALNLLGTSSFGKFIKKNIGDKVELRQLGKKLSHLTLSSEEESIFFEIADGIDIAFYLLNRVRGPWDREGYLKYFDFLQEIEMEPFFNSIHERIHYHLYRGEIEIAESVGLDSLERSDNSEKLSIYMALNRELPCDFNFSSKKEWVDYLWYLFLQGRRELKFFSKKFLNESKFTKEQIYYVDATLLYALSSNKDETFVESFKDSIKDIPILSGRYGLILGRPI